jgi:hypothetical protein
VHPEPEVVAPLQVPATTFLNPISAGLAEQLLGWQVPASAEKMPAWQVMVMEPDGVNPVAQLRSQDVPDGVLELLHEPEETCPTPTEGGFEQEFGLHEPVTTDQLPVVQVVANDPTSVKLGSQAKTQLEPEDSMPVHVPRTNPFDPTPFGRDEHDAATQRPVRLVKVPEAHEITIEPAAA